MNLSDVQVFMKVMDDMWKNSKGYGEPEKNITGYLELDMDGEDGYGVCRNMASDVARKLNAIDENYNARIIPVYLGEDGSYKIADIERKIVENDDTVKDQEKDEENTAYEDNKAEKIVTKIFGNHMVTLVDVKEDNLTIVLDPTNPGIGIYKNGRIVMLNSSKEDGLKFEAKEYSSYIVTQGGVKGFLNVTGDYLKSFEASNLKFEQIEKKYGIEAQNIALKEIRKMEETKNSFKENLKIDISQNKEEREQNDKMKMIERTMEQR